MYEEMKQRIIQEHVPGKQITLAHVISNPQPELFNVLELDKEKGNAIGILNITPCEGVIIAADVATKTVEVNIGFLERSDGSLMITGDVSSVETAIKEVINYFTEKLNYDCVSMTQM
ncbi:BMC domain-containing protein [Vibrio sp. JC009]|uniref:BMC domain-containing protein n=1 Tax=Vibrio sp. JC009 TaxID=2912314 RepID=UPI0023B16F30|nr:BMC domain-containing protein [Vibrio sp. JC009]WED21114.1 BMC domain-containing protein [Vibrio sp. JC009]